MKIVYLKESDTHKYCTQSFPIITPRLLLLFSDEFSGINAVIFMLSAIQSFTFYFSYDDMYHINSYTDQVVDTSVQKETISTQNEDFSV